LIPEVTTLFRGRFFHTIDDKGRVAIPSRFRDLLLSAKETSASKDNTTLVITNTEHCLAAYPLDEWQILEQRIATLPQFDPKVAAFRRIFIGCAQECTIDSTGRILIPSDLRNDAGIEKEITFVGQLQKFEIWSTSRWNQMFQQGSDQFTQIATELASRGIGL